MTYLLYDWENNESARSTLHTSVQIKNSWQISMLSANHNEGIFSVAK